VIKNAAYYSRVELAFSADGRSYDWKSEVSTDGKTWVPFAQQEGRTVSSRLLVPAETRRL
jgi:hypothetical protein